MIDFKYLKLLKQQNTLSLYIHIPFCVTKCYYCAFYSEDKNCWDKDTVNSYISKLNKELFVLKENYDNFFETVFIGGGNPGVLSIEQLRNLLINIGPSRETTFEINPESLTLDHLRLFKEGLATRISVGIQSFNDDILKILGRNARRKDNLKALQFCKTLDSLKIVINDNYFIKNNIISEEEYKKSNTTIKYSFDLMSSLPTQKLEDSINDIDTINSICDLKHLSLYCLSVEEGTDLYRLVENKKINKNSDLFEKDLLENLWAHLSKLGYEHYEVSNFTKDKNYCLHNLRYWNLSPYISLGSTSASTIYDKETLIRINNTASIKDYNNSPLFSFYDDEILNKAQFLDEYLIVSLRNNRGLNYDSMEKHFNITKGMLLKAFSKINKENYVVDQDSLYLNEEGIILLDTIILTISIELEKLKNIN